MAANSGDINLSTNSTQPGDVKRGALLRYLTVQATLSDTWKLVTGRDLVDSDVDEMHLRAMAFTPIDVKVDEKSHELALNEFKTTKILLTSPDLNFNNVKTFLEQGAEIDAQDMWGRTALHYAARVDNLAIISHLIDKGANLNARDNKGRTALHHAVEVNNKAIISHLIDKGADINVQDKDGLTPLHLAAQSEKEELMTLLRMKGADSELKDNANHAPQFYFALLSCDTTSFFHRIKKEDKGGPDESNSKYISSNRCHPGFDG